MYDRNDIKKIDLKNGFGRGAELRARWAIEFKQPLVLISQVQRSGGHLLAWLFDGHPECLAYPHELKWGRPTKNYWPSFDIALARDPDTLFDMMNEDWPDDCARRSGFFRASKVPESGLDANDPVYPFVYDSDLRRELFRQFLNAPQCRRDVFNAFLSSFFNSWLDCQGIYHPKKWITAFIPQIVQTEGSLDGYFADYPDGHLISIVRHPAAWMASAKGRRYAKVNVWRESTLATLDAAAKWPDKVSVVMFDDLVHRTREVMEFLCRRLGLQFHEQMLKPTYNSMPMLSNSSHKSTTEVDSSSTERYLQVLDSQELKKIEKKLLPLYRKADARHGLSGGGSVSSSRFSLKSVFRR